MSEAENRRMLARYVAEVWDAADPEAVRIFAGPGYRRHTSGSSDPLGVDAQVQRLVALRAAFPDMTLTIDDVVAERDRVAFRGTLRGTHRGEFLGVPATGRTVAVAILDIIRVEGGLVAEHWGGPDLYDLTRQLVG